MKHKYHQRPERDGKRIKKNVGKKERLAEEIEKEDVWDVLEEELDIEEIDIEEIDIEEAISPALSNPGEHGI